jgi:ubiquitin carboxyl-terminal hydrolase 22/27/51
MSSNSTQVSSAESPPSASATSISTSSEVTSGCIHLAQYVQSDQETKGGFADGLTRARKRAQKSNDAGNLALQYHCVQCVGKGDAKHIETHCTDTQHAFSFCSQSSSIYCAQCKDLIYDKTTRSARIDHPSASSNVAKKRKAGDANDDDSYITSNSAKRPCGREGARGLFNLGHTCYMNAVIQSMVHNSLLSSFFLGKGHPLHTCTKNGDEEEEVPCVACGFTEVFSESRVAENTQPMAALSLLKASWLAIPVRDTCLFRRK